jgi:hypothetical protein
MVEPLPSLHEALSSASGTKEKKFFVHKNESSQTFTSDTLFDEQIQHLVQ